MLFCCWSSIYVIALCTGFARGWLRADAKASLNSMSNGVEIVIPICLYCTTIQFSYFLMFCFPIGRPHEVSSLNWNTFQNSAAQGESIMLFAFLLCLLSCLILVCDTCDPQSTMIPTKGLRSLGKSLGSVCFLVFAASGWRHDVQLLTHRERILAR